MKIDAEFETWIQAGLCPRARARSMTPSNSRSWRAVEASRAPSGELTWVEVVQAGLFKPLGKGDVPVAEVIQLLENGGYQGWYVLEQDVAITGDEPAYGMGPIDDVRESEGEGKKTLTVVLRYGRGKDSAIDGVRRVSAPGRRVYVRFDRIPRVRSGMGISILSTSRGVMTDRQALEQKVGGELLCEVW